MSTLFIVGTPLGNLEDLSPRATRVLGEVSLIAAEDTRRTGKLLNHLKIKTPLTSYFEHNKGLKLDAISDALSADDVALVSDGGMPVISDPGYELVKKALADGHAVTPIPGPSAISAALAASGLPSDSFVFLGFLPRKDSARRQVLRENATERRTLIAFEAPHRLLDSLADLDAELGDRPVTVARELTKLNEEFFRGTAQSAREHFSAKSVQGEITLVIGGAPPAARWPEEKVQWALAKAAQSGLEPTAAARDIARESGWPRREVYRMAIEEKRKA